MAAATMAAPSSLSHYRRVEGGAWSKANRFYAPESNVDSPGPGASYHLPSLFSEHAPGPVYRQEFQSPKAADGSASARSMPHPSRDRTAWMIGSTKNELAYYNNIAGNMGPAFYNPSLHHTTPTSPRALFSKNRRFMSLTHRYISKEHNNSNLCTASPGPQYNPKLSHLDLTRAFAPEYSFGGQGVSDRGAFVHGAIKRGYLYTARPATSDPHTNVGPAQYRVRHERVEKASPRPVWGRADRFAAQDKIFLSKRHQRAKLGGAGLDAPMYYPRNHELANNLKQSGKPANIPAGKWCP